MSERRAKPRTGPQPVLRASAPRFPTRTRWRAQGSQAAPLAAMGFIAASAIQLSACDALLPIVAPIFEHGAGQSALGCVVVSPPAYLTEEEALEVLHEELLAAGYDPSGGEACASYAVDQLRVSAWTGDGEILEGAAVHDRFDACDRSAGLALEVVTREDHARYEVVNGFGMSTVRFEDIKAMAQHVALQVAGGAPPGYYGIAYDPREPGGGAELEELDADWEEGRSWQQEYESSARCRLLLRRQLRDILDWIEGRQR